MKAFLNWSGGKDSALCLQKARQEGPKIEALVTTINESNSRITMHGVRRSLLEQQAAALQMPLHIIELPEEAGMAAYEEAISQMNRTLRSKGFTHAVSGDLFLEELKTYREQLYANDGIGCLFPLWKTNTKELMNTFLSSAFKAIIVCINSTFLDKSFCGRLLDESFISDLPDGVDDCGENGEYHSFVFDGPGFRHPVYFKKGEILSREYPSPVHKKDLCFTSTPPAISFYFCDLLPSPGSQH